MTGNSIRCVVTLLKLSPPQVADVGAALVRMDAHMTDCGAVSHTVAGCDAAWLFIDPTVAVESAAAGLRLLYATTRYSGVALRARLAADFGTLSHAGGEVQGASLEGAREALRVAPDHALAITPELLRHLRDDLQPRVWRLAPVGEPALAPPPQTAFAYDWNDELGRSRDMPVRPSGGHADASTCLELRQGDRALRLYANDCPVSVGRDEACRLRLQGPSASRFHGRIEFDGTRFVFVDDSRNGSYLMTAHGDEIFLRGERVPLSGVGVISPGVPLTSQPGEVLRFRCHEAAVALGA